MIFQILVHTPVWVWMILAFLIYRGLLASRDREVSRWQMCIVPAVFLWLSLDGIARSFGSQHGAVLAWAFGVLAGVGIAWLSFDAQRMSLLPDGKTVFVRGSWKPMLLMMAIFLTKYATGIALAMQPARAQNLGFVVAVCLLYGMCNGMFFAQLLRLFTLQRRIAA
ncbi:hypothetical protein ELE36_08305 [Pseudolysobacter antarcticus]|uniref:DUF1453 domain-containing protein n=1 Tax=Pseudolysobacter antarcticus TaxID=2511995 RepID=A0A411HIN8_9GAMM|nr:DUF6622 family protein [Pseudolysobacter antarcticus]QBB70368.1 hypothetical protein ELE36_08305 [Pseudolysobacter antarcticus]